VSFNSTFGGDREMREFAFVAGEFAFVAGEFAFVADMLRSIVWRIEKFSRLSFPIHAQGYRFIGMRFLAGRARSE
jgi:hypothetical protein